MFRIRIRIRIQGYVGITINAAFCLQTKRPLLNNPWYAKFPTQPTAVGPRTSHLTLHHVGSDRSHDPVLPLLPE